MGFKIDKIISISVYDKNHNPVLWIDGDPSMSIETDSVLPTNTLKEGDHVYMSATKKYSGETYTMEWDGFFGGET